MILSFDLKLLVRPFIVVQMMIAGMLWSSFDLQSQEYSAPFSIEKHIIHVQIEADGSSVEIEEKVKVIKSQSIVSSHSQVDLAFNATLDNLEILEAYTIAPDGKKIPVEKNQIRLVEDDISSGRSMFSDTRHLIIIYPNVTPGAKIYYKAKLTSQPLFEKIIKVVSIFHPLHNSIILSTTLATPQIYPCILI